MACVHDAQRLVFNLAEIKDSNGEFEKWGIVDAYRCCVVCKEVLSLDASLLAAEVYEMPVIRERETNATT